VIRDPAATYDVLDRKQPHRLGFMQFARAIPGYVDQFTGRVPPNFFVLTDEGVVDVACPCGATPSCEFMAPTACVCDRTFVYTGGDVRVAYALPSEEGVTSYAEA
jgi:hypothetical protein